MRPGPRLQVSDGQAHVFLRQRSVRTLVLWEGVFVVGDFLHLPGTREGDAEVGRVPHVLGMADLG